MRPWLGLARRSVEGIVACCFLISAALVQAEERCQTFVEALRGRDYYDLALDYLHAMRTSPLADKAFRDIIDYELGVTLVEGVRSLPAKERDKQLDEARGCFRKFVSEHPNHLLSAVADRYLASIEVERGQAKLEQARQSGKTPAEKNQLLEEVRRQFSDAEKALMASDALLSARQKGYKDVEKDDVEAIKERDQLRTDIILTRLALAKIPYHTAYTYEPGSKERKDHLLAAADKFGDYYSKYRRYLISFSFRLEQARCNREAGNTTAAIEILEDLSSIEPIEDETIRRIRTAATVMAMQTYLLPQERKYSEAWRAYENWQSSVQRPGESVGEAAVIKCLAGEAALELARWLNPTDPAAVQSRETYLRQAKELLTFAARFQGDLQLKARLKLIDPLLADNNVRVAGPTSYEEARDRAILACSRLREPTFKTQQPQQLRSEAFACLRFALAHQPRDAAIDELNILRCCYADLSLTAEDYYVAAVLGEFLAHRYPDRPQGQAGAKIALLAYDKLANQVTRDDNRRFESQRLREIAQYTTDRWPSSATADDAWLILGRAALARRKLDQALESFRKIGPDSARRGEAEIIVGQALWQAYRDATRLPEEQQPPAAKMAAMLLEAQTTLEAGIRRIVKGMRRADVPYAVVAATLSLSEALLEMGKAEQAAAWLDEPHIGPHTLSKMQSKITDRGNFRADCYRAALRAYVASQQLTKAEQALSALEKNHASDNLTRVYLGLGRQMEDWLKRASASGKSEDIVRVARGLEFVSAHIVSRPARETGFEPLYWSAEMFVKLAGIFDTGSGKLPVEAADYYSKAVQVYGKLIAACQADEISEPKPGALMNAQIRRARCLRRLEKYEETVEALAELLQQRPNALDAQQEMAVTYQMWGEKMPDSFLTAIRGCKLPRPNGSEVTAWGWGGIAGRVESSDAHQDVFYQARYNLASCRMKYALTRSGEERLDVLRQAEQDISIVQRLHPEMGGKKWYNQYDGLLRQIQQLLGIKQSQQGLKAAEQQLSAISTE